MKYDAMQRVTTEVPNKGMPRVQGSHKLLDMKFSNRQKRVMRYIAAGTCFLSELVHLWLLPGQYEMFSVYGIIFLLIAITQGFLGVSLLFEPHRRIMTFGIWINGLVVLLYTFTHTIGVLVGEAFLPLAVDASGVVATLAEILAFSLLLLLRRDFKYVKGQKRRKQENKKM